MHPWQKWGSTLLLGAALGAAHAQILVGQTAGFTGMAHAGVNEASAGAKLYLDAINARGGVNGQKIEIVSMDDKFDPKIADFLLENRGKTDEETAEQLSPVRDFTVE